MSTITGGAVVLPKEGSPERGPLLLWMIFTGLSIFAAVLLGRYGLIRLMVSSSMELKAATTRGSKWVPASAEIISRASPSDIAGR